MVLSYKKNEWKKHLQISTSQIKNLGIYIKPANKVQIWGSFGVRICYTKKKKKKNKKAVYHQQWSQPPHLVQHYPDESLSQEWIIKPTDEIGFHFTLVGGNAGCSGIVRNKQWKGNGMDEPVTCVPGMEDFLRRRDLPSYCRVNDPTDQILQFFVKEVFKTSRADVFLLNTFEDLEAPILSHLRSHFPKLYTIGPLHTHLKTRLVTETTSSQSSNSLWQEDRNCMKWLDAKPLKSVIYVSFGSVTVVTREEIMEFCYGLVNSKKFFLWVIRPDSVIEKEEGHQIPTELLEGTKERGYMLGWAPQEVILAHPAFGGFLTHSGWNSTSESIVAGVPMICWPYLGDQHVISRFVSEAWKIGLDMKDRCDRVTVENMVNEVMEVRKE